METKKEYEARGRNAIHAAAFNFDFIAEMLAHGEIEKAKQLALLISERLSLYLAQKPKGA